MFTFEVYRVETVRGRFVTERKTIMLGSVQADSEEMAERIARMYYGVFTYIQFAF